MVAVSVRLLLVASVALSVSAAVLPRAAPGTLPITSSCQRDSDCDTSCCGFTSGRCAGALVAAVRDGGCGRGEATPNNKAPKPVAATKAMAATSKASGAKPAVPTGTQFVTGPCTKDAECETGCCGFASGKCAGAIIAQTRDGGCGRGEATPNNKAAVALLGDKAPKPVAATKAGAATSKASGIRPAVPTGTQFVTGPCTMDAECETGCCGFNSGKCAGALISQSRDGGCGRGDKTPNNNAAVALLGDKAPRAPGVPAPATKVAAGAEAPASPTKATNVKPARPTGTQFITGKCSKDFECDSGCCGFQTGKCAGGVIAQTRDGGCGRGDKTPNNNIAKAILGDKAPRAPGVPRSLARML